MSENIFEKIRGGARIVDVRTKAEYNQEHYPNAINIPVDEIEHRLSEFNSKTDCIILYCVSGVRSEQAASILKKNGYTHVINAGGISNMPKNFT